MMYPFGYGAAEHRRALDALLADLDQHGGDKGAAPPAKRPTLRLVRDGDEPEDCPIEIRASEPQTSRL